MSNRKRSLLIALVLVAFARPLAAQESAGVTALQSKGQALMQGGQAVEGIKAFEDAVALAKKEYGSDDERTFLVQGTLAQALQAVGRFADAAAMCQNYASGMEAKYGPNDVRTCIAKVTLGRMYSAAGRFAEAVTCLSRALTGMEGRIEPDHVAFIDGLEGLLSSYINLGRPSDAEPHLRRKIQILEAKKGLEDADTVSDQIRLMVLLQNSDRLKLAEEYIERAVDILKARVGMDHVQTARLLDAQAQLKIFRGRHAEAEPLLKHARAVLEKSLGPDAPETCKVICTLGDLYRLTGRFGEAEPLLRHNLKMTLERFGLIHPDTLEAHQRLSKLLAETGRVPEAQALMQTALDATVKAVGPNHPIAISFRSDLQALAGAKGANKGAPGAMARDRRDNEKAFGKGSPIAAISDYNEAATLVIAGRFAEAEPRMKESLDAIRAALGPDHPAIGAGLGHLCHIYNSLGHYKESEEYARRCVAFYEEKFGLEHPDTAASREILATSLLELGRALEAIEQIDMARRVQRRILDRTLPALSEDDQIALLRSRMGTAYSIDMNNAMDVKNAPNVADVSASWILNHKAVANAALAQRAILARAAADPNVAPIVRDLTEARRSLAALAFAPVAQRPTDAAPGKKFEQLVARERELSRQLGQALNQRVLDDPWVPLNEVRAALPSDAMLIEFGWYDKAPNTEPFGNQANKPQSSRQGRYAAWVIPPAGGGDVRMIDLGQSEPIDQAISAVRQAIRFDAKQYEADGEPDYEKRVFPSLEALSRLILGPLRSHIDPAARWVVSPDASLWLVPWQALPVADGVYAIERHEIHLVVSGRDVAAPPGATSSSPTIIFADPDFDSPGQDPKAIANGPAQRKYNFPRLEFTGSEAKGIDEQLRQNAGDEPTVYTGAAATESAFRNLRRPRVLVLSTHGFFGDLSDAASSAGLPANPLLRCGLILAGANNGSVTDAAVPGQIGDDGVLTGLEIVGADLTGTGMVVLSACETGLGQVQSGEGVAGLRQAFQLAGAHAVVATLWSVPDKSSADLVVGFFKQLSSGLGPASALRRAQLEAIGQRRSSMGAAHPYFWAAFTLTGQPGAKWASESLGDDVKPAPAGEVVARSPIAEKTRGLDASPGPKTARAAAPRAPSTTPAARPTPEVKGTIPPGRTDDMNPFVEGAMMIVVLVSAVAAGRWWWLKGPQAGV